MNNIFEFRKQLNFKKIFFLIVIFLFLLIISVELISNLFKNNDKNKISDTKSTFYDTNKSISITLPNTYNLKQYDSKKNYLIELNSSQNLTILISNKNIINNRKLSDVIFADRNLYIKNFSNTTDISEISSVYINQDIPAFTYNFNYLEENQKFNLQTIWLESNDRYFIIDIKFPIIEKDLYNNLIKEITSSFSILEDKI